MLRNWIDPRRAAPDGAVALEVLDNDMNVRGANRLAQEDQSGKAANDVGAGKSTKRRRADSPREANLGAALRSVYSQTVDEAIPPEFLDLLNKLD